MSRSPPGVQRIVSILNFLADHPDRAFSLTELVRALKLSRATCHGLLTGLVDAGYLYRSRDKSYRLGPAVIAIGSIAKDHFSPLNAARPEMRALADEFDASCIAAFRENMDAVVRERSSSRSNLGYSVPRDTRLPLLPEFAPVFFAEADESTIEDWLDMHDPPSTEGERKRLRAGISFLRSNGYLVGIINETAKMVVGEGDWIARRRMAEAPLHPLHELDSKKEYRLSFISAPVMDGKETAFALALQGFQRSYSGAEIEKIGERLRQSCDTVASFLSHS